MEMEIAKVPTLSGNMVYVVRHKDAYRPGKYQVLSYPIIKYKDAKDYMNYLQEVANTEKDPIKEYRNRYVTSNN